MSDYSKLTDRELDALVAERLFGWQWYERAHFNGVMLRALFPPEDSAQWHRVNFYSDFSLCTDLSAELFSDWDRLGATSVKSGMPQYSTDIADAWEVVRYMHLSGFWLKLQSPFEMLDRSWNAGFTAHSCTGWNGRPDHKGQAESAARAICLAALAAQPEISQ